MLLSSPCTVITVAAPPPLQTAATLYFAWFQLMKKRGKMRRTGNAQGVSKGDGTTKRVHISTFEINDLEEPRQFATIYRWVSRE